MADVKIPPTQRIVSHFKELAVATSECNDAASALSDEVSMLSAFLARLKPQVSAWHRIAGCDADEDGSYWSRDIGYTRVGPEWGIALRRTWGNEVVGHHGEEIWLFRDAPRWICIESAGKLPDLFEELVKRTKEATDKLRSRTQQTKELSEALAAVAPEVVSSKSEKTKTGRPKV